MPVGAHDLLEKRFQHTVVSDFRIERNNGYRHIFLGGSECFEPLEHSNIVVGWSGADHVDVVGQRRVFGHLVQGGNPVWRVRLCQRSLRVVGLHKPLDRVRQASLTLLVLFRRRIRRLPGVGGSVLGEDHNVEAFHRLGNVVIPNHGLQELLHLLLRLLQPLGHLVAGLTQDQHVFTGSLQPQLGLLHISRSQQRVGPSVGVRLGELSEHFPLQVLTLRLGEVPLRGLVLRLLELLHESTYLLFSDLQMLLQRLGIFQDFFPRHILQGVFTPHFG
mmetsp:Transcript_12961/g.31213  ORF Transcript_12961/g.31213 Transcript_12961/m.31213 type:complete len:275 (+) Transcript_12961:470-1294(+)